MCLQITRVSIRVSCAQEFGKQILSHSFCPRWIFWLEEANELGPLLHAVISALEFATTSSHSITRPPAKALYPPTNRRLCSLVTNPEEFFGNYRRLIHRAACRRPFQCSRLPAFENSLTSQLISCSTRDSPPERATLPLPGPSMTNFGLNQTSDS